MVSIDRSEIGKATVPNYENKQIPLHIKDVSLKGSTMWVSPHWHDDFEFFYVVEGEFGYRINETTFKLSAGDFLFINSSVMHCFHLLSEGENHSLCIMFQPSLLTGNKYIEGKYYDPIYKLNPIDFLYFPKNTSQSEQCAKWLHMIVDAYHNQPDGYELSAIAGINMIMQLLYHEFASYSPVANAHSKIGEKEKKMISFIYHNYQDDISLEDIANAGNVSVHSCCRLFKNYLDLSPVKFLNNYRLEVAENLLLTTEYTIQEIANLCGYDSCAYFIKQFKNAYHVTPYKYRKQKLENAE